MRALLRRLLPWAFPSGDYEALRRNMRGRRELGLAAAQTRTTQPRGEI